VKYAYLVGSAGAALIWLAFWFDADTHRRSVMLRVSTVAALTGLAEPLFIPTYWNPPTLFDLNHRTGFDIESVVFQFAGGGIAAAIYGALRRIRQMRMVAAEHHSSRYRFHRIALAVPPLVFVALAATTKVNPIYITVVALFAGAAATCLSRPDLIRKIFASGLLFLGLYFAFFLMFNAVYPHYLFQVWNLHALSGMIIAGVPLEELLYAFSYGLMLSSVAEHFARTREDRTMNMIRSDQDVRPLFARTR